LNIRIASGVGFNMTSQPFRDTLIEGFSHIVASMTAPIASGWSGCRVGFAPTGKRRLVTAHTQLGHRPIVIDVGSAPFVPRCPVAIVLSFLICFA
jgi:hypothetical protein